MSIHMNKGTKLQLGDNANPPVFVDIPHLRNIPGIEEEQEKVDVTSHSSGSYRKYMPSGLIDPGDYEFEMQTDRSNVVHQTIFALKKSGAAVPFRLLYPDGYCLQFDASVLSIKRNEADPQSPDVIIDTVGLAFEGEITDVSDDLLS